ncbi:hypothetical protein [Urbifossiella limnaea]|uniref:Uncharacterized protein n=1 Tax=Urbifossiella limnaea TaxID=2528023 RepID=A0A517Y2W0_9BACT|nr:hypothetical protein [Urbifossiella limnaea]QDU24038.1 hypothetical protein ETAA1_60490 [Urbifossiella limnaea]
MAPLSTADAAAILGWSVSQVKGFARAAGIRPLRIGGRDRRPRRLMWSARHLLALMLAAPLRQLGVRDEDAIAFIRGIANLSSDEALEAVVKDRPFALVAAPHLCPHLLDAGAVRAAGEAGGEALMMQGRQLTAVSLSDLYADLIARMRRAAVGGAADAKR